MIHNQVFILFIPKFLPLLPFFKYPQCTESVISNSLQSSSKICYRAPFLYLVNWERNVFLSLWQKPLILSLSSKTFCFLRNKLLGTDSVSIFWFWAWYPINFANSSFLGGGLRIDLNHQIWIISATHTTIWLHISPIARLVIISFMFFISLIPEG